MTRRRCADRSEASVDGRDVDRQDATSEMPVVRLLGQVDRQFMRLLELRVLTGHGLTVDQWRVLDIVSDGEDHTMSDIAASVVVPGATLTKIMDRLVDAALVYRLVDSRDRRRVLSVLSEKGAALHAELAPAVAAVEQEALSGLGEDATVLVELLAALAGGAGNADGTAGEA